MNLRNTSTANDTNKGPGVCMGGKVAAILSTVLLFVHAGSAQTVKQVFAFSSAHSSPTPGWVIPAQGRDGNLYGTTTGLGVTVTDGIVFKATTSGKELALHTFDNIDGAFPFGGVTSATDGSFYGTTANGGNLGFGVLFKITPGGAYKLLHEFSGGSDGAYPNAPPIQGWDGNYYGSTGMATGKGATIYKLTPSGVLTTIFSFKDDGSEGTQIESALLQASDGSLYGVGNSGGAQNCGAIFRISRAGMLLYDYSFPCAAGGAYPAAALIQASDGNFYGTTELGGSGVNCSSGCGIVFKMDKKGPVSILHNFLGGRDDGSDPVAGLVEGTDGNLYGATFQGGTANAGTVFQISKSGTETLLHSFTSDVGQWPVASLAQNTNGKFYGVTQSGGTYNEGVLYSLDMGLGPFITFVLPAGRIGQPAQMLGQGLTGATSVTFNGIPATSFTVVKDTYMTAVVPAGATTGSVVVTTPTGKLTSNVAFHVLK